jgi:oligopeptide/dipeptide ABC transporter ATP-binding protein
MPEAAPLLRVRDLKKYFPIRGGMLGRITGNVQAVDGVSFDVFPRETLGLVGESGCGKTTLARTIIRLLDPTEGSIEFELDGRTVDLAHSSQRDLRPLRRHIQYIFQDPYSSLNSRMTIERILTEPANINGIDSPAERRDRARSMLERVGLKPDMLSRYPNEFSGGQRQRIVVARALMLEPKLIICDEPVSALDVSVQAQVLNLLKELQDDFGFTYVFIAHDLSVVDYISDRIMVMYLGRIVEHGKPDELYRRPKHPYTEALMKSIATPDPRARKRETPPAGGVPDPSNPPVGCHFHPRCPYAVDECREIDPALEPVVSEPERSAACIRKDDISLKGYYDMRTSEPDRSLSDANTQRGGI